jgi:restriction system protein
MWEKRIIHEGLHAFRVVRGHTEEEVETKARLQLEAWADTWKRRQEQQAAAERRLWKKSLLERQVDIDRRAKSVATERTREAESTLYTVRTLLVDALTKPQVFDWESLRDKKRFCNPRPLDPTPAALPMEPLRSAPHFEVNAVKVTLKPTDWIIPGRRRKKILAAQTLFASAF